MTHDIVLATAIALTDAVDVPGVARSHVAALNVIRCTTDVSITSLAAALGLSHSAAVRVVDRLAQERLVERIPAGPARRVSLRLTASGRAVANSAARRREDRVSQAISTLSRAEQVQLLAMLGKVGKGLAPSLAMAERACRLCNQPACLRAGCPLPWDDRPRVDRL
jgi:MarR family transcriptional repressor of emrRAB